ncbi:immunity protein Imm33 domain-containing protein [Flavobacterium hauense]
MGSNDICDKYNCEYLPLEENSIIGISRSVKEGLMPIHGLRHPIERNTSGWHIWSGDYSENPNFFEPMHAYHLKEICPYIIKYLGLPPGYRFLITDDGYEDVWEDKSLLDI